MNAALAYAEIPVAAEIPASPSRIRRMSLSTSCEATTRTKGPTLYDRKTGTEGLLRDRLADALRRRLAPHTNLTTKQLAYTLHTSEKTIWKCLNGRNDPSAETLRRMVEFFGADFVGAVFALDCQFFKLSDRKAADAIRKIEEGKRELAAALGTGTEND